MKAIDQFLWQVDWGELDVLLVDLPPGTGDAQLSLVQRVYLNGAVVVTTPSDVALGVVRRGFEMFGKVDVPVLGIVENMSHFICPHCGEKTNIFSSGGGKEISEKLKTKFLGEIPLDTSIRTAGDKGMPVMATDEHSPQSMRFKKLADNVWDAVVEEYPTWEMNGCHFYMNPEEKK